LSVGVIAASPESSTTENRNQDMRRLARKEKGQRRNRREGREESVGRWWEREGRGRVTNVTSG
jgi:hypothetical protein